MYQSQRSPRVLRRDAIHQHIGLRGDNGRVDETKEKEAANQRTNGVVGRFRVFTLLTFLLGIIEPVSFKGKANPCKTPYLFTDPTDTVWDSLHAFYYRQQKTVGNFHEHG